MEPSPLSPSLSAPSRVSNRRDLARQYKESPPPMGVYVIRNLVNQRVFVGASANPEGAMNRDRFELRLQGHRNRKLMQDWIAHGAENFSFELVDTVKKSDDPAFDAKAELAALHAMWCGEFDCYGEGGYNTRGSSASRKQR
jgi:hypothetical protein